MLDAEKVFVEENHEKFAEVQRGSRLIWSCSATIPLSLLANFSPSWQKLEITKIRQVLRKMRTKKIFLNLTRRSRSPWGVQEKDFLSGGKAVVKVNIFLKSDNFLIKISRKSRGFSVLLFWFFFCCFHHFWNYIFHTRKVNMPKVDMKCCFCKVHPKVQHYNDLVRKTVTDVQIYVA